MQSDDRFCGACGSGVGKSHIFCRRCGGRLGEPLTLDLLTAIDKGKSDVVQRHMDSGTDPNKNPGPVRTPLAGAYPLHLAVVKGNKEIVQILLDNGAEIDIKAKNKDAATPLAWAAFFIQKDMVSLLIESEAPINALDAHEHTSLDSAFFRLDA